MAGLIEKDQFEKAYNLHQRILVTAQMAQKNLYDMCVLLKEMRDDKLYKELGYQNFEDYCENEVGFSRRNARNYIAVIEHFDGKSISRFGVTKLSLLAALSESEQEKIQATVNVEDTSVRELKAEIARLRADGQRLQQDAEEEKQKRLSCESDLLAVKSKNRALSHELEEVKKNVSPNAKTQDALIRQLDRQLSVADQEHANALERQRKEYQAKINSLQEQLKNAAKVTEVAVETVEVPAVKEIFEAYCNVVKNAFGVLAEFVKCNREYIQPTGQMIRQLDDDLCDIRREATDV